MIIYKSVLKGGKSIISINKIMLGIGYNEVVRSFAKNNVDILFVAKNADQFIKRKPINIASKNNIEIKYIDTKKKLGKLCKIDRSAAVAVKKIDSNK